MGLQKRLIEINNDLLTFEMRHRNDVSKFDKDKERRKKYFERKNLVKYFDRLKNGRD